MEEDELKVGTMTKRAQKMKSIGPINFKDRVFVLTRNKLSYYEGTQYQRGKIKGSFGVETISFVGPVTDKALNRTSTFQIIHNGCHLYCCARGTADRDEWVEAIKQACKWKGITLATAYHPNIYNSGKWQCCGNSNKNSKGCRSSEGRHDKLSTGFDTDGTSNGLELPEIHFQPPVNVPNVEVKQYSRSTPSTAPVVPPKSKELTQPSYPPSNFRPGIAESVSRMNLGNDDHSISRLQSSDVPPPVSQRRGSEASKKSNTFSGAYRQGLQETSQAASFGLPSSSNNYPNGGRSYTAEFDTLPNANSYGVKTNYPSLGRSYSQHNHSTGQILSSYEQHSVQEFSIPPPLPKNNHEEDSNVVVAMYDFEPVEPDDIALRTDERYTVLDKSRPHWWKMRNKNGTEGYAPANYVKDETEMSDGLEQQSWFQKDISRMRAEYVLKEDGKEGSFIVRHSSQPSCIYTLSVVSKVGCVTGPVLVKHYHIKLNDQNKYYLSDKHSKPTLMELIEYHRLNAGGMVTRLRQAPASLSGMDQPSTHLFSNSQWEIDISEVEMLQELGSGQFGVVKLARVRGSKYVAIKIMKENTMEEDQFIEEAEVMTHLQHKNLVELYGVVTKQRPICIVTEFMEEGCLLDYIRKNAHLQAHPETLLDMCYQVCDAMKYLETKGMIHRDLAARNCLVGRNMIIKVADFGLTRFVQDDEYTSSLGSKFPIKWAAPEVLNYTKFSSKSDVWAFGILMWELFTGGKMPYPALSNPEVVDRVVNGHRLQRPNNCPHDVYQQMLRCWDIQPNNRPSFEILFIALDDLIDTVNASCTPEGEYDGY